MTQLVRPNSGPWYGQIWGKLKNFPHVLAQGAKKAPTVSGPAAAAFIGAAIGCFTMMVSHHLGDTNKGINDALWTIGSWIPGSKNPSLMWGNIGSYTGKETMLLVGWLVSWPILHYFWKDTNVKAKTILFWMFTLIIAATAMSWHPLFPYMPLI